jgi:uncharacterized protein (TIGR02231 family)
MIALLFFLVNLDVFSKIDSVIIYSDRVMITRLANVYLDRSTDLVFADLPGAIDDASVRVKAKGLKIGEVQVKKGYKDEPYPDVEKLKSKIEALKIRDRTYADEIAVLKSKEKFLQTIAVGGPEVISKEIIFGKVSPQAWRQGLNFMVDELLSAKMRMAEIERVRKELQDEINVFQRELNDIRSIVENRKTIIFDGHPQGAKNYRIQLSYILYGASWCTYYELRAQPSKGNIGFSYFSKVAQRTGEDWENTKLVLSTAQPALGGTAPVPTPWYIDRYAVTKTEGIRGGRTEEIERFMDTPATARVTAPPPAPPVEAGVSIWYPLPGRYTIKSGDPEKKIKIFSTSFKSDFEYFIIPRITQRAYSTGKMKNTSDYLFIGGQAGTYVGDDFTGKTYVPTIAPDESTTVSFGVDDRVKVKRELKKSKVSKGGLFSGKKKYEFTYENTVKNFHNKKIQCTIVDQIPIPQDPDIKVKDIKIDPEPSEHDKDIGIYYWKVSLDPTEEYKVTISFTVEAPGDSEIQGLMP